jgi:hypothetical protein
MGFNFGLKAMVGPLFGLALLAGILALLRRTGRPPRLRPPPRDGSMLFALRFMLSCTSLGLSVAWLTTQSAYSWPIWGLLTYFGASGVISYLVFGVRNSRWIWQIQSMSIRGWLTLLLLCLLVAVGGIAVVAALDRGDRANWTFCGLSLAAVAAFSWSAVQWADPEGG